MNRTAVIATLSLYLGGATSVALGGAIDRGLLEVIEQAEPGEVISTLVYLQDQGDVSGLLEQLHEQGASREHRAEEVILHLQDTAELSQAALLDHIATLNRPGQIETVQPYWIANIIQVDATVNIIEQIAEHPDVLRIYYNIPIELIEPADEGDDLDQGGLITGGVEPGVEAVRAPEVWAMGFTGSGILVATIDTGVDGNHPTLANRWRGLDSQYDGNPEWAWFDPSGSTSFPTDFGSGSHGTHTMGTVVGGAPGDQIGVAPGAQWIHGAALQGSISQQISRIIQSFQWMANPTGNPSNTWAIPHVCSNSWGTTGGMGHPACDETFWQWIDNSEAVGTLHIFSAGNEGLSGLRRPADRALNDFQSVAVAAVDGNDPSWTLASFSSQGPTSCTEDGSSAIKPEISAPGVSVRSAVAGTGYGFKSGTSMASPHINGVAALMLEACPDLTGDEIMQIIYDTAVDLGSPGKNNQYGYGMIDAVEAVQVALGSCSFTLQLPEGVPSLMDPGVSESFDVIIAPGKEDIVPGSEQLFYRYGGGDFIAVPLEHVEDDLYEAVLPAPTCDEVPQFYVQAEGDAGTVRTSPPNAPDNFYQADVGDIVDELVLDQTFEDGLPAGWSMSGLWNVTGACAIPGDCPQTQWAYYGQVNTCNYETGSSANSGEMLSAPIAIPEVPADGVVTVSFCYTLETEASASWDVATFSVVGGPSQQLGDSANWTTFSMDVTSFAGQTIQLSWHFDTIDGLFNDYHGWQVDRVRIEVTTLECDDVTPCVGDLTGDGTVGVPDLLALIGQWGDCDGCDADLTGSGSVGVEDLLILINNWGSCE